LVFTYFGFLALGVSLIWLAGNGNAEDRATSLGAFGDSYESVFWC
jgi:hypothetical protein